MPRLPRAESRCRIALRAPRTTNQKGSLRAGLFHANHVTMGQGGDQCGPVFPSPHRAFDFFGDCVGSSAHRIIGKMRVARRGLRLGVAEQLAYDGQSMPAAAPILAKL